MQMDGLARSGATIAPKDALFAAMGVGHPGRPMATLLDCARKLRPLPFSGLPGDRQ